MIDINKTYRTRDGLEVRIYATDGDNNKTIHGAVWSDGWQFRLWYADGSYNKDIESKMDLIEVRPRHKRTVWVTIYPMNRYHISDENIQCDIYPPKRIACIKVELDFEEGQGL